MNWIDKLKMTLIFIIIFALALIGAGGIVTAEMIPNPPMSLGVGISLYASSVIIFIVYVWWEFRKMDMMEDRWWR